jgi:hypothetical protein
MMGRVCYYTFAVSPEGSAPLLRCARCQNAYYASREAQKAHWRTHKRTCSAPNPGEIEGSLADCVGALTKMMRDPSLMDGNTVPLIRHIRTLLEHDDDSPAAAERVAQTGLALHAMTRLCLQLTDQSKLERCVFRAAAGNAKRANAKLKALAAHLVALTDCLPRRQVPRNAVGRARNGRLPPRRIARVPAPRAAPQPVPEWSGRGRPRPPGARAAAYAPRKRLRNAPPDRSWPFLRRRPSSCGGTRGGAVRVRARDLPIRVQHAGPLVRAAAAGPRPRRGHLQ